MLANVWSYTWPSMKETEMDKQKQTLEALFHQQQALCESLAEKAVTLVDGIKSDAPMETLLHIMEERSSIVDRLNTGDGKIRETLSLPGSERLLEDEGIKALKKGLETLLNDIMKVDGNAIQLLNEAFAEAQNDLSAISAGHKTVSAYGKQGKPMFAKFFDRRF